MTYLRYFKNKAEELAAVGKFHNLMSSSVPSPDKLLDKAFFNRKAAHRKALRQVKKLVHGGHLRQWGDRRLIEAIRRHYGHGHGAELPGAGGAVQILPVAGSSPGLWFVIQAMARRRPSRVLVETPSYGPLFEVPKYGGLSVDWLPRRGGCYEIDPAEVRRLVTPSTRLVLLSNLHNPSGHFLAPASLLAIAAAARDRNPAVRILVDETFGDFAGTPFTPAAVLDPIFISVSSLTKVYGLGALRCGWVLATGETFEAIQEAWLQGQNVGCPVTEAMATVALEDDRFMAWSKKRLARQRVMVEQKLALLDGRLEQVFPPHGCICFPQVKGGRAEELCAELEIKDRVAIVPGRFFRAPEHVRLGFGGYLRDDDLEAALDAFCEGVTRVIDRSTGSRARSKSA